MTSKKILNIDNVEYIDIGHGDGFACQLGPVAGVIGLGKIGCNVSVYAPGKAAFPFHSHRVNDELFFVLEGQGQVRIGNDTHSIKQGDFVGLPADSGNAHQIKNTGTEPLKVLSLSSELKPEIAEYPDQGKVGVIADWPTFGQPGEPPREPPLRKFFRMDDSVDYWDGVD